MNVRRLAPIAGALLIATSAMGQTLIAPDRALLDEAFIIHVRGLRPGAHGTLRATMPDSAGRTWISEATFEADGKGEFSTAQSPLSGDYTGSHPMGLVWAMDIEGRPGNLRYTSPDVAHVPLNVSLVIDSKTIKAITIDRRFLDDRVERVQISRDTGLVWSLFRPKSRSSIAAILVVGGSEGGNSAEDIAAALANHGYTAASLAYFNAPGLPAELKQIPLEYFQRAITALESSGRDGEQRIGILATSKGAEAALLVASIDPRVRAIVAYAPSSVAWSCICEESARSSWTLGGNDVSSIKPGRDPSYRPAGPLKPAANYRYRMLIAANIADASIRADRYKGRLMLIAGEDDQLWHSQEMSRQLQAKRSASGSGRRDRYLYYPGAGHFIGKLYLPSGSTRIAGGRIETGGSSFANALAQEDSWKKVLDFFTSALGNTPIRR